MNPLSSDLPSTPPEYLYHYTGGCGLTGIIRSKAIWATEIRHLNDTSELRYPRELLLSTAERLRPEFPSNWSAEVVADIVKALAESPDCPDTFVASFCVDGDNLGQWRGYSDGGQGFAIGFDRDRLAKVARPHGYSLARLQYEKSEQEEQLESAVRDAIPILADWSDNKDAAPSASMQLLLLGYGFLFAMLSVKHPFFRDEREWRLVRVVLPQEPVNRGTRMSGTTPVPYEVVSLVDQDGRTPIHEVVIGPLASPEWSGQRMRQLLDENDLATVPIRVSGGPIRRN